MLSNHLIRCRPLLLLPSIFPNIRVFSNESALHIRWSKCWSSSFNISPSNEHPGLISFRMDWLDLLAVQGTLKSLLQHHISKASILQHSAFFIAQLSHLYMTIGKNIALNRWSRNTWSNRQIWPWSTELSRAKANRVLSREPAGHSKHSLSRDNSPTRHHQMVNTKIRLTMFFVAEDGEALYTQQKQTGS